MKKEKKEKDRKKKKKLKKRKNNIYKESSRRIGDLGQRRESSKVKERNQEISFSKVL